MQVSVDFMKSNLLAEVSSYVIITSKKVSEISHDAVKKYLQNTDYIQRVQTNLPRLALMLSRELTKHSIYSVFKETRRD